jgi:glucose-1-phosphate thymidylyltransferase
MLEANRMILDSLEPMILGEVDGTSEIHGKVVIEKNARIVGSTLRGPLIIGENTEVIDSYVGPFTSIASGCRIEGSEIEHSIVLADSSILHVGSRIEDSLIGRNACITKSNGRPSAYRVMVGDHSRVEIR